MEQRLAVASTSTDHFDQRSATSDFDSKEVSGSALLLRSGGTSDVSTLSSSATGSSYLLSSTTSWSSGAAGLDALQAEEVMEIADRMVQDGRLSAVLRELVDRGDYALDKWFTMLDVEWVLNIKELSSQCGEWTLVHSLSKRWIRAFTIMLHVFVTTLQNGSRRDDQTDDAQFAGFVKVSILKNLRFVDVVIAAVNSMPENLPDALGVYAYISGTPSKYGAYANRMLRELMFKEAWWLRSDQERYAAQQAVVSAYGAAQADLRTRKEELAIAIRSVLKKTADKFDAGATWAAPQGSEVHPATRNALDFIRLLSSNKGLIYSLTIDSNEYYRADRMTSVVGWRWRQLLNRVAMSQPDVALRSIFLINNYDAMEEVLPAGYFFLRGTEDSVERYLEAAWEPVISPLREPVAARRRTELVDFMKRFLTTYRAQKLWRVLSPILRAKLRKDVTEMVLSAYTNYLKENPLKDKDRLRIKPWEPKDIEEMLNELFEG